MHLLRQSPFARLFAGTALNALGTWATLIALWGYAAVHFHQGAHGLAMIGLAWGVPAAVAAPLAGVPIDRFGPKRVLLAANLLGAMASAGLALASTFDVLVVVSAFAGVVESFGRPAAMALPARIVAADDLLAANALINAAEQSSIVFGPVVGAAAITAWGITSAFVLDCATFLVGAAAVASLHPAASRAEQRPSVLRELAAGLAVARRSVTIRRALALAVVAYLSWGAFFILEPLYVRTVLHRSPAVLGLLQTAFGTGLVGVSLLVPRLGDRLVGVRALAGTVVAAGVMAAAYVGTPLIVVAFVGVGGWGMVVGLFVSPLQTLLQRAAPPDAEGRILALSSTANAIGNTATIPVAAALAAAIGVQATGAVVGCGLIVAGLAGIAIASRSPAPREERRLLSGCGPAAEAVVAAVDDAPPAEPPLAPLTA